MTFTLAAVALTFLSAVFVSAQQTTSQTAQELYNARLRLVAAHNAAGNFQEAASLLAQTREQGKGKFEWGYWNREINDAAFVLPGSPPRRVLIPRSGGIPPQIVKTTLHPRYLLALSADGRRLLLTESGTRLEIWDVPTRKRLHVFQPKIQNESIRCGAFSPDGSRIATGDSEGNLTVRNAEEGIVLAYVPAESSHFQTDSVDFSFDGRRLLVKTSDYKRTVLEAATGKIVRQYDTSSDGSLWAFAPDTDAVFRVNGNSSVVFSLTSLQTESISLYNPQGTSPLSLTPDNSVCVLRVPGQSPTAYATTHRGESYSIAGAYGNQFTPLLADPNQLGEKNRSADKKRLFLLEQQPSQLVLREAATGRTVRTLRGQAQDWSGVVASRNSRWCAARSPDGTIRVWNIGEMMRQTTEFERVPAGKDAELDAELKNSMNWDKRLSPHGALMLTRNKDWEKQLVEVATGTPRIAWNNSVDIVCAAFSADGSRLVTGGEDKMVRIWDTATGTELLALPVDQKIIRQISIAPDSSRVVAVDTGGNVLQWTADFRADFSLASAGEQK